MEPRGARDRRRGGASGAGVVDTGVNMQDITKLPRWVQDTIRNLTQERDALLSSRAPHDGSMISWGYEVDNSVPHGNIPTGSVVTFHINKDLHTSIRCRMDEESRLHVSASHALGIEPRACNLIYCKSVYL